MDTELGLLVVFCSAFHHRIGAFFGCGFAETARLAQLSSDLLADGFRFPAHVLR
jgi:hypothetical protein